MSGDWRLFLTITLPLAALMVINQASRTVMAIIGPVLAVEFSLSASQLGLLAACMLVAYGLAQLPDGVALDRVGPRRVQAAFAVLTAAGFAVFALSASLAELVVARILLGIGVSATLIAVLKANNEWFPPRKVATMTAIAVALGGLGSVLTTAPAQFVLPALGWRGLMWVLCALSLAVALWTFVSVRDKPAPRAPAGLKSELAVVLSIYRSRTFWRYAPAVAALSALNFAYLGLWAGPWLRDVAGYEGQARANTLLLYTLANMTGALVTGAATSRVHARRYPPATVLLACNAGLLGAQIGLALAPGGAGVPLLWMLFAFFASGASAGYVVVNHMFPPEQTARVSTAVNMLALGAAFLLQSAIGWLLDLWPRTGAGGWDPRGYSAALALTVGIQALVATRLFFLVKR